LKRTINEEFFDRLNESSAYILGYLFADGSVKAKPKYYILSINGQDREVIEQILEEMESNHEIKEIGNSYRVSISSKRLVESLMRWGLRPIKKENLKFPYMIPKELMSHFIRGYFDGKGCWLVEKGRRITINFACGSEEFLEGLRDELVLMGLKRAEVHRYSKEAIGSYYLRYYVRDTKKLYYIMYYKAGIYSRPKRAKYDQGYN
jgi:intein/homing endonuclease